MNTSTTYSHIGLLISVICHPASSPLKTIEIAKDIVIVILFVIVKGKNMPWQQTQITIVWKSTYILVNENIM